MSLKHLLSKEQRARTTAYVLHTRYVSNVAHQILKKIRAMAKMGSHKVSAWAKVVNDKDLSYESSHTLKENN